MARDTCWPNVEMMIRARQGEILTVMDKAKDPVCRLEEYGDRKARQNGGGAV